MPASIRAKTELQLRSMVKSGQTGLKAVGGVSGLYLRILRSKTGEPLTTWVLRVRRKDKKVTMRGLGTWPDVSLAEARSRATKALQELDSPENTSERLAQKEEERKQAEVQAMIDAKAAVKFADLIKEWFDQEEKKGHWKNPLQDRIRDEGRIRIHVLSSLGDKSIMRLTTRDVAEALRPIWCSKPATAKKILVLLREFFRWATLIKELRDPSQINPADVRYVSQYLPSERLQKKAENQPYLPPEVVPDFFADLVRQKGAAPRCLELAIMLCLRSANARGLKWRSVDLEKGLVTFSPNEMKVASNGQHIIPLPSQAAWILSEMRKLDAFDGLAGPDDFVFSSRYGRGGELSNTALNTVIRTMSAASLAQGGAGWLDPEQSSLQGRPVVAVQHGISRASFETWAHEQGADQRLIDLCLHHVVDRRYNGAYDRASNLERKRDLLQSWADFCYSKAKNRPPVCDI